MRRISDLQSFTLTIRKLEGLATTNAEGLSPDFDNLYASPKITRRLSDNCWRHSMTPMRPVKMGFE